MIKTGKTIDLQLKPTTGMDSLYPNTPINMYNMDIKSVNIKFAKFPIISCDRKRAWPVKKFPTNKFLETFFGVCMDQYQHINEKSSLLTAISR